MDKTNDLMQCDNCNWLGSVDDLITKPETLRDVSHCPRCESDQIVDSPITREVMEQYEQLRRLGPCNMFDLGCVQLYAEQMEFYELAELDRGDYLYILKNFSQLMAHYEIEQ